MSAGFYFSRWIGLTAWIGICFLAMLPVAAQRQSASPEEYLQKLEWRGVLSLGDEAEFSFHHADGEGSGFWIRPGQIRGGIEVIDYNIQQNRVTVRRGEAVRTLSLSDAFVKNLEGEVSASPPPLVVIDGRQSGEDSGEQKEQPLPDGIEGTWQQALEESGQLREIDQQMRKINEDEVRVAESLSSLSEDDPAFSRLKDRQQEIQEQRRVLTEGALTEIGKVQAISGVARQMLETGLRRGLSRKLMPIPRPLEGGEPPDLPESNAAIQRSLAEGAQRP